MARLLHSHSPSRRPGDTAPANSGWLVRALLLVTLVLVLLIPVVRADDPATTTATPGFSTDDSAVSKIAASAETSIADVPVATRAGARLETADKATISDDPTQKYVCSSIYGTNTVLRSYRPALVNVSFTPQGQLHGGDSTTATRVSVVVFNWLDQYHLGVPNPLNNNLTKVYVCTDDAIELGLCDRTTYGQMLVDDPNGLASPMISRYIDLAQTDAGGLEDIISYPVSETGIYCVDVLGNGGQFRGEVQWINPYGSLPAIDYPKILFYGLLTLTYLLVTLWWAVGTIRYWREILPMQNYLSLLLLCLLVDYAVEFWFNQHYNAHGTKAMSLTVFLIILSSLRNSLSFLLLLLIALGYSVVKPSLGRTMLKCQILAGLQLLFSSLYGVATIARFGHDDSELVAFIALLPLAITMVTFYVWILTAMTKTVRYLQQRHQHFKLTMYRQLWRLLFFCACVILLLVVVNAFSFGFRADPRWIVFRWRLRWLLFDGWLNCLYTFAFFVILFIWRPTPHNSRYGLEELAGDETTANARDEDFSPLNSPSLAPAGAGLGAGAAAAYLRGNADVGNRHGGDGDAYLDPAIALRQFNSPDHFDDFLNRGDESDDDEDDHSTCGSRQANDNDVRGFPTGPRSHNTSGYSATLQDDPPSPDHHRSGLSRSKSLGGPAAKAASSPPVATQDAMTTLFDAGDHFDDGDDHHTTSENDRHSNSPGDGSTTLLGGGSATSRSRGAAPLAGQLHEHDSDEEGRHDEFSDFQQGGAK
ncbi:hypothetical protein IWQ60_006372 [Tieghemiomyces parasiticus]|uniref:Membrane protein PTM1 n=1 Tax=Tieghemiomyces parasiticus TaxID=78921 RepID=A0A9W8A4H8_9FUNG|nr:hypothetical protein IWQ60_006372 [Tieghemiomyces parasiticus]